MMTNPPSLSVGIATHLPCPKRQQANFTMPFLLDVRLYVYKTVRFLVEPETYDFKADNNAGAEGATETLYGATVCGSSTTIL
jgi:hypothetical protein